MSAERRLLDLLAGWGDYVEQCSQSEEPHPGTARAEYEHEAERIRDLYQQAGGFTEMTPEAVDAFVDRFIKPLLREGTKT